MNPPRDKHGVELFAGDEIRLRDGQVVQIRLHTVDATRPEIYFRSFKSGKLASRWCYADEVELVKRKEAQQ